MQANKVVNRCKNCNQIFSGNYCNNCGQDAHTGKIDFHFLVHEIQHSLFHVDKGILFTVRQLFTRPGHMLREFIAGQRVKHFRPLAFLVIVAGLHAFINHYLHFSSLVPVYAKDEGVNNVIGQINEWSAHHYLLLMLLQLPLLSWVYYLFFRKYKTGYLEQLLINVYLSGQKILIRLILFPLFYVIPGGTVLTNILVPLGLSVWAYSQFYHKEPRFTVIKRAFLGYVSFYVLNVVLLSILLTILKNIA